MSRRVDERPAWRALAARHGAIGKRLDSKNRVDDETMRLLVGLARLDTSSRRLRVASLAGTFFIGMLLSVDWIERRHSVQSIECIPPPNSQQL